MRIRNAIRKGLAILALAGAVAMNYNPSLDDFSAKKIKSFSPENKYAVLICGMDDIFRKTMRGTYWSLVCSGFKKENIYVLDQAGNSFPEEYRKKSYDYPASGISTKKNVLRLFSMLEKKIGENDMLVVYFSDHGLRETVLKDGKPKDVSSVALQDYFMNEEEIYNALSRIHPMKGIVNTDTCLGGGIAKKIGKIKNFIGISASEEYEISISDWNANFFSRFFYSAFVDKEDSDTNKDGTVTVKEAFEYARKKNPCSNGENFPYLPKMTPLLIPETDTDSVTLE